MTQFTKRNADVAFEEGLKNTPSKKKKGKVKVKSEAHVDAKVGSTSVRPKMSTAEYQLASSTTPARPSLEDRITVPKSLPELTIESARVKHTSSEENRKGSHDKKHLHKKNHILSRGHSNTSSWKLLSASAGIFIDHDPILTADNQILILLTKHHIHVYSTSTSLLVRSILIKDNDILLCGAITEVDRDALLVATKKGALIKVNFMTGSKTERWEVETPLRYITPVHDETGRDCFLAIRSKEEQEDKLVMFFLEKRGQFQSTRLLQGNTLGKSAFASTNASIIVVSGSGSVHVGLCTTDDTAAYTWHEIPVEGSVTCFDVHTVNQNSNSRSKTPLASLVVGLQNGTIFVYDNIVQQLLRNPKGSQRRELNSRKLHWHRNRVGSVKWSRDGNYVISGGEETVLVLWQLETNQQQFLPHLSTSILNITVSAAGAHYALQLGDNSVMILSTADLSPSTNIVGLLLPATTNSSRSLQTQLHPTHPNRLLSAVPIRPSGPLSTGSATHLQTYDIDTGLQFSRQALTRNVTTAVNLTPDGQALQEPDVTHLQISADGNWLATIDTWSPTSAEMQALYLREEDQTYRQTHTETTLRFWTWNREDDSWEIITRINEPHAAAKFSVLALASNPVATEFATLGEDGSVKIWKPRRRVRDGVQVRDRSGQPLFTWTCSRVITVERSGLDAFVAEQPLGVLAYANDGSVLAASWSRKQRHVHLVDPRTGALCTSIPHLVAEGNATIAVMGRFLLCLSSNLKVFDMVSLQTTWVIPVKQSRNSFLSVNRHTNSFVIGINPSDRYQPVSLSVFAIENPDTGSIADFKLSRPIQAVLAEPSRGGYIVIDNDNRIHRLLSPGGYSSSSLALKQLSVQVNDDPARTLGDVFGPDKRNVTDVSHHQEPVDGSNRLQNLSDILAVPSTAAQLGVSELFDRVSKVISGMQLQVGA